MRNVENLRWTFVLTLAVVLVGMLLQSAPLTIGVSQQWSNGQYHLAAGSSPWLLLVAVWISVLYFLLLSAEPHRSGTALEGVVQRFFAFFLDFVVAMIVIAPIVGIVPMLFEWRRTGVFRWHFERHVWVGSDSWITYGPMPLIFAALLFYFVFPLMRGRPSPGTCILGYQVVSETEQVPNFDKASLRSLLCIFALLIWPISAFAGRDRKKGQFWVDKICKTRAVRFN